MSKRAAVAVGVSIGLLAFAQAIALFVLGSRLDVPADPLKDPIVDDVMRRLAYNRNAFHLLGTLLAGPWLAGLPGLASLGRLPRLLFVPWAISALSWLAWALQGLRMPDRLELVAGIAGLASAGIVGGGALILFAVRYARSAADRPAAGRGIVLAVFVLVWTCAFAVAPIRIGASA
jgi:hypothetical protein